MPLVSYPLALHFEMNLRKIRPYRRNSGKTFKLRNFVCKKHRMLSDAHWCNFVCPRFALVSSGRYFPDLNKLADSSKKPTFAPFLSLTQIRNFKSKSSLLTFQKTLRNNSDEYAFLQSVLFLASYTFTRLLVVGLACKLGVTLDKSSQVPKKLTEILLVLLSCSTVQLLLGHVGCC